MYQLVTRLGPLKTEAQKLVALAALSANGVDGDLLGVAACIISGAHSGDIT
jgi:hypothetical protein